MSQQFSPSKLRAVRIDRGYSRQQLATAIRRNVDQVGAWERGRDIPNNASLTRLLHALNCRVEDVFEDSAGIGIPVGAGAGGSQTPDGVAPAPKSSHRRPR